MLSSSEGVESGRELDGVGDGGVEWQEGGVGVGVSLELGEAIKLVVYE